MAEGTTRPRRPRLLVVGTSISVHTTRNLRAIAGLGWDIHLFAASHTEVNSELRDVTLHLDPFAIERFGPFDPSLTIEPLAPSGTNGPLMPGERAVELARLIRSLRPDLLHTAEIQIAGYLALDAARVAGGRLPAWIAGVFGVDLYYYTRIPRHRSRLRGVMGAADYLLADNHRDVALARSLGFDGRALPVLVVGGGFDLDEVQRLRRPGAPSRRRAIAARLQAYWTYRPRVILEALELCEASLEGYELEAYFLSENLREPAERLCVELGMNLRVVSEMTAYAPHSDVLAMHGRSRVSLGAAITDGTSLAPIEAAVMGSFPIHSYQSAVGEWLRHGRQTLLFDGRDPRALAEALRRALTEDELVDRAAKENELLLAELDARRERRRLEDAYERALADQARRCSAA